MKISGLELTETDGRARLSAVAEYEDFERPAVELLFEVDVKHSDSLRKIYEPFLLACLPAALFHGERRVFVDGDLCPEVRSNAGAALRLQTMWFGAKILPVVESAGVRTLSRTSRKTACLISGGVDSLSTFCRNIALYRDGDPRRISQGIFAYGLDVGNPELEDRHDIFDTSKALLEGFLNRHGCSLIPVYTNARDIEPHGSFYATRQFGALLAGIGHAVSGDFERCLTALDLRVDHYDPWGSHPWLNKYYSSSGLDFESQMESFTRIDKYEFLAEYPDSLKALRVCFNTDRIPEGSINCGKCNKCLRTKMELAANGMADKAKTFGCNSIKMDIEDIKRISAFHLHESEFLKETANKFRKNGKSDFADILDKKNAELTRRIRRQRRRRHLIDSIKAFDESYLAGSILGSYRTIRDRL